ncbi:MAG: AAA family ATPase [Candidatus Competibacteraceae bacterium]
MYTTYFGFENKPFKPKDSKDYYRNDNFDSACADILSGIREQRGFILLTGEAGFGKTLVLRRCMAEAADIFFILLNNANLDFPDILNYLCISLQLPAEGLNIEQQSRLLLDTVAAHARRNQPVALLIDDAQHLRIGVLSRLLDFVEAAVEPDQRLRIVLAGLPEIEGKLRQPELRRLHEQVQVRCHLERLSGMETELFINHQFKAAGYAGEGLFSPAVIERIDHYSQGVPRAVAMLCDAMFLFASLESEREITPGLVDEAARNCFLGERAQSGSGTVGPLWQDAVGETGSAPADGDGFDLRLDLDLDLPLDFDLDLDLDPDRTSVVERSVVTAEEELKRAPIPPRESASVPPVAESPTEVDPTRQRWSGPVPRHPPSRRRRANPYPRRQSPKPGGGRSGASDGVGQYRATRRAGAVRCRVDGVGPARICPVTGRTRRQTGIPGTTGSGGGGLFSEPVSALGAWRPGAGGRVPATHRPVDGNPAAGTGESGGRREPGLGTGKHALRAAGQSQLVVVSGNPPAAAQPRPGICR